MIYEVRTYDLKMRSLGEVIKQFGDVIEPRQKLSPLIGCWYTEFGPLNQLIHIWSYESFEERAAVRAETAHLDGWPPQLGDFILKQSVEVYGLWPFSPKLTPGNHGPYYEMRSYLIHADRMALTKEKWERSLPERVKRSPLATIMECEIGTASKILHIWPYNSLDERMAIRNQAVADGIWPPKGDGPIDVISQENKLMMPVLFSPMQ